MSEMDVHKLTGAYAMDALDELERARFEQHLATCEDCRAEVAELRENGLAGTVDEVVDKIGRYAESGQTRLYLQTLDLHDLDHLRLVAAEVMPQVA